MPNLQHIYLTAHGHYKTGHWVGETAQIGLRLAIEEVGNGIALGSVFNMGESGEVEAVSVSTGDAAGTLAQTWTARLGGLGSLDNADAAFQIDLAKDFKVFLSALQTYQASTFAWTHVKIAPILASGKYGAAASLFQFVGAGVEGVAASTQPPEVACALSLRAPVMGRRGRGRMYIPALSNGGTVIASDGTVAAALQTALNTAGQTLITSLEDAPGVEQWSPVVCVTSAGSLTAVRPSELRVGNHFDVQRRRQHQVTESYAIETL